ncbi:type IV secretion protein Rhs [Kosakonia cowanii]|uniref:type IV secretion protein Rhs n=1 Tax=Kosakonia cowanii TaxID=208223 RepID=UPI002DDD5FBA|nr:type IV secretion protein Rhs [Kosakonia cowanii]WRY57865.1 type IV secretion protein Rhs [Kosakonia cowanii]
MTLSEEVKKKITDHYGTEVIVEDWGYIVDDLSKSFRWSGSKIQWSTVSGHEFRKLDGRYGDWLMQINAFISGGAASDAINTNGLFYYVNDSSLDFAVLMETSQFYSFLDYVINSIPQHHYFTDEKKRWCLVISSEGYIDFGYSNKNL